MTCSTCPAPLGWGGDKATLLFCFPSHPPTQLQGMPVRKHHSLQSLNTWHYLDFMNPSTAVVLKSPDGSAEPVRKLNKCDME